MLMCFRLFLPSEWFLKVFIWQLWVPSESESQETIRQRIFKEAKHN